MNAVIARALESELAKLGRFQGGKSGSKVARGFAARGAVAPKYRNPENPGETWAGRGLKPRWLAAAIKSGKKPEDFLFPESRRQKQMEAKRSARRESGQRNSRISHALPRGAIVKVKPCRLPRIQNYELTLPLRRCREAFHCPLKPLASGIFSPNA
jgi:hypothetical protein